MALSMDKVTLVIFCSVISFSFSQDNNHNNWNFYKADYKTDSSNTLTSSFDSSYGQNSNDSLKYAVLSELDDFVPDRTIDEKYSYNTGGFYIPHEREAKLNYHFEEVTNSDKSENIGHIFDEGSSKDSNSKILAGSTATETGVIEIPTFLSVLKKIVFNPLVIISIAVVPLAFVIETIFPYISNIFSGNVLPNVATTIVTEFARSLDGDKALHVEQILDVLNEFGVKALEDPKCLQKFLCQFAKPQSKGSWSIQKFVQKLENSIDGEILNKHGLKSWFHSLKSSTCESFVCTGSPAYTQNPTLIEKFYLLSRKFFNMFEVGH